MIIAATTDARAKQGLATELSRIAERVAAIQHDLHKRGERERKMHGVANDDEELQRQARLGPAYCTAVVA